MMAEFHLMQLHTKCMCRGHVGTDGVYCVWKKIKNHIAAFFSGCLLCKQEISFLLADIPNENMGEKYKCVRVKRIKNEGR